MTNLDALERAALAATPGPWIIPKNTSEIIGADNTLVSSCFSGDKNGSADFERMLSNARHIAAANPSVIVELIRRLRDAETENSELRVKADAYEQSLSNGWTATNIKNGNQYTVTGEAINTTNAQDGQLMVIYERDGKKLVREACEFQDKFTTTE